MATGLRTSFTDSSIHKRSVSDMIQFTDPNELPLISRLGLDGSKKLRLVNWPSVKPEWIEDTFSPRSTIAIKTVASGAVTTFDTVTTAHSDYFQPGMVVRASGDELLWVSASSGGTVTVVRDFGGTTGASQTSASTVDIIGVARLEGDESDEGYSTTTSQPYNYTQIFHKEIKVSRTQQKITKYGIDDEYNYQLHKIMGGGDGFGGKGRGGELPILLETAAVKGQRASAAAATSARAFGGLDYYISTNHASGSAGAVSQDMLMTDMQTCWTAGGNPKIVVCGGFQKRSISGLYQSYIQTERAERYGGLRIDTLETDFGNVELLLSRWVDADTYYIIDPDKVGFLTLDGFFEHELAITGDYMRSEVIGEYSFFVCNETHHAKRSNLSTS